MAKVLAPLFRQGFLNATKTGPLAGGLVYTYVAGTSTPLATYTDSSGATPNTNPIVLDANGECDIYIGNSVYKIVLKDSNGVTQWTRDNIQNPTFVGTVADAAAASATEAAGYAANASTSQTAAATSATNAASSATAAASSATAASTSASGASTSASNASSSATAAAGSATAASTSASNASTSATNAANSASAAATSASNAATSETNAANSATSASNSAASIGTVSTTNTANAIVKRDGSGNFAAGVITANLTGNVTGNVTGNASTATSATSFTGSLAGEVSGPQGTTVVSNAAVIAKVLTSLNTTAGTPTATDSILSAIGKNTGQITTNTTNIASNTSAIALKAPIASPTFTGNVTAPIIIQAETTTPATPSAGFRKIYPKSDGYYQLDSSGVETKVGSGAGGAVNYITGGDFEAGVVGAVFKDADATTGVLNGGAPTATITTTGTNPLNSTTSGVYTPQAGIGAGWSRLISINREDQAQILQGVLSMEIATYASYTDGDLKIAAYDVTNGARLAVIEGETIPKVSGPYKHTFRVQTAYNSQSYRIGFVQTTTTTTWGSLKFEISLGPQLINRGASDSDLVSYTPVFTGLGTVTNIDIRSRKSGAFLEVIGKFTVGTPTATLANMTLGYGGISGNVTSIAFAGTTAVGWAIRSVNATALDTILGVASSNLVYFGSQQTGAAGLTGLNGSAQFAAGQDVSVNIRIPIQGWSSNTALSSDVSVRPAIFRATGIPTGTLANGSFNVATFPTVQVDNYGKYSGSTYTIPKTGYYDLYWSTNFTGSYSAYGAAWVGFLINGSSTNYYKYAITSASTGQLQATTEERGVFLAAGTTIQPTAEVPGWTAAVYCADSSVHTFSIIESAANSGQQIAATERICATYGMTTPQSVSATSVIKFDTKVEDTHGRYDPATGLFTSNFAGRLRISTVLTASIASLAYIVKNGTGAGYVASPTGSGMAGSSVELAISTGDTVGIYMNSAATAYGTATQGYQNQVTFERVT